jgi:hypothetical protein
MVMGSHTFGPGGTTFFAVQEAGEAVLERLDPPRRAAVVMALLGLTLVGLFLITFIMVGGHWVRRLARHRPGKRQFVTKVATEAEFREALDGILPERNSNDTILLDTASKDTKVDT